MVRALEKSGYHLAWTRVETEADYQSALETAPDIILADYQLPQFSGLRALALLKQRKLDIPLILVSGTIGEENAAEVMRLGADDYMLKGRLQRLGPAVGRAVQEAQERWARRSAQQALREAEQRFRSFTRHLPGRASIKDLDGRYSFVNETWLSAFGKEAAAVLGRSYEEILPAERVAGLKRAHQQVIATDKPLTRVFRTGADDNFRWWLSTHFPIRDASEKTVLIGTISIDVTEQKVQEEKIARLTRIYAVLSGINAAIIRIGDRNELFKEACRIAVEQGGFGIAWIDTLDADTLDIIPAACAGIAAESFLMRVRSTARSDAPLGSGLAGRAIREKRVVYSNDLLTESSVGGERRKEAIRRGLRSAITLPLLVGSTVVGSMSLFAREANFFNDDEVKLLTDLAGDISFALDHISKEEKIEYLAYYDVLTGLANRTLFYERLEQAIAAAGREQRKLALVIQDIERFRSINDTLGRQSGDVLLRQVAQRMSGVATSPDWLGRVGADHFAVLVPDVTTEEELARRAQQRMREIYGQPFRVGDVDLRISARIGIAMFPADGADADTLLRNAETAVKRAKAGGERLLFYTEAMTERVAEKLNLENKLRDALEKDEFVLHYQPKIHLETRAILGVEALIRWQSAELGLVSPGEFIPLLEETGLILDVGAWALKRAAMDRRHWIELGIPAPRIAVNVSAVQMRQRDFVRVVKDALGYGGSPAGIDLEITETLLMENLQDNISKLEKIRALGVSIAIDDFGTGYSSLAYLAKLPVHALKIDRSFVSAMLQSPQNMTIVSTIISLAHSLDLKVIAEGVETEEQSHLLKLLKCDEAQGYLFSRPVPREQIELLISAGH